MRRFPYGRQGLRTAHLTLAAGLLLGCLNLEPECTQPTAIEGEPALVVVSYNIGNTRKTGNYPLRIADQAYEDHLGERLRGLSADIVLLQEVLTPTQCAGFEETDPLLTCYDAEAREAPAKRLLGDDYTVVCDANRHVECIGVKTTFGSIPGVPLGGFVLDGAATEPLPGPACDYLAGECVGRSRNCDSESSISSVVVLRAGGSPLRVVHAHPTAIGEICLQRQLEQAFALVDELDTVLGGDFNFDPSRASDLAATAIWSDWVGEGRRFHNHSGYIGDCRLERTSVNQVVSLDRVVTDFAYGLCQVWQSPRLDDGFDFEQLLGSRADHLAVVCPLVEDVP